MSNEMMTVLSRLAEKFGIMIDWTSDNLAPYLTELYSRIVTYNRFIYTAGEITGLAVLIVCGVLIYRMYKRVDGKYDVDYDMFEIIVTTAAAVVLIIFAALMIRHISNAVSAWMLPEKLILQLLSNT